MCVDVGWNTEDVPGIEERERERPERERERGKSLHRAEG